MKQTLAIIGASVGQKALYYKAKRMGLRVIGFACDRGVIDENLFDEFYEISVTDVKAIVTICKNIGVDGVVTNASDFLTFYASKIAENLCLVCTPSNVIENIQNKSKVRNLTLDIESLSYPKFCTYPDIIQNIFPCVVKPSKGAAKKGVSYCENKDELLNALEYAGFKDNEVLIEEYIPGREFSVESLSYQGKHKIIQITDKECSGPPHFVELGHHQPAIISERLKSKIEKSVAQILDRVCYQNGASHIELKYNEAQDQLYLIEINCRGGGDHISDTLVSLSTNCDYIKEIINIALNCHRPKPVNNICFAGICYLCYQNRDLLRYFNDPKPNWILYSERTNSSLSNSTTNYDRDGYFIYKAERKPNI